MEFKGQCSFREIDRARVEVQATEADAWVKQLLEQSAPQVIEALGITPQEWAARAQFSVYVSAEKMGLDYGVRGHFEGQVLAPCSRCGEAFHSSRKSAGEFNVVVKRVGRGQAEEGEDLDSGDPDYLITESDTLDIIGIIREQLIILEPLVECPESDEAGNCKLCGLCPRTQFSTETTNTFAASLGAVLQKIRR